ncbi:MAG TPA: hypothetical protein VID47_00180 [Actinomycetota bacterium]
MTELRAHALAVDLPRRWEGRIFRHAGGEPTLHAANFALPPTDGDYGARATSSMGKGGAFVAITEFESELANQPLFHRNGLPRRLRPADLHPRSMMRPRPGFAGVQRFFHDRGRAFCLYVVVGNEPSRSGLCHVVNEVLASVEIDRRPQS